MQRKQKQYTKVSGSQPSVIPDKANKQQKAIIATVITVTTATGWVVAVVGTKVKAGIIILLNIRQSVRSVIYYFMLPCNCVSECACL